MDAFVLDIDIYLITSSILFLGLFQSNLNNHESIALRNTIKPGPLRTASQIKQDKFFISRPSYQHRLKPRLLQ